METAFTPFLSLSGGILIGVATVLFMLLHGRIFGATGLLSGVVFPVDASEWSLRVAVLVGMVSGPLVFAYVTGGFPVIQVPVSTTMLVIGGFLVGVGVTFGSGCTSGHGVCGLARLSKRSLAATATFMAGAGITVHVLRHVIGG